MQGLPVVHYKLGSSGASRQHHGVPSPSRLMANHIQLGPCQAEPWQHHRTKSPSRSTLSAWVPATEAQSTGRNSPRSCEWASLGERTCLIPHLHTHSLLPHLPSIGVPSTAGAPGDLLKSALLPTGSDYSVNNMPTAIPSADVEAVKPSCPCSLGTVLQEVQNSKARSSWS